MKNILLAALSIGSGYRTYLLGIGGVAATAAYATGMIDHETWLTTMGVLIPGAQVFLRAAVRR